MLKQEESHKSKAILEGKLSPAALRKRALGRGAPSVEVGWGGCCSMCGWCKGQQEELLKVAVLR